MADEPSRSPVSVEMDGAVAELERKVEGLRERAMRRTVVLERLLSLDSPALVAFLVSLLRRVDSGQGRSRALLQEMALEPAVFSDIPYDRVAGAYALARQRGDEAVARLFLGPAACPNPTVDEAFTGNEHLDLPIGVRTAAARTGDRFTLDRLLHDRDRRVVRALLDNPRIVERDVVKIAAMRPTRPEVLEVVALHARWSSRYVVRKALAGNPYTPTPIARRLLPTLLRQDLRQVIEAGVLRGDLADDAARLLRDREQTGEE